MNIFSWYHVLHLRNPMKNINKIAVLHPLDIARVQTCVHITYVTKNKDILSLPAFPHTNITIMY